MTKDKTTSSTETSTSKEVIIEKSKPTVSDKIWNEINGLNIDMFGLSHQKVNQYCQPVNIDPNKLYLSYKVGAFLPALETLLASKYDVELMEKFITVSYKR